MFRELVIQHNGMGVPTVFPSAEPDWSSPVCLLVHGYNVDPAGASRAWERLLALFRHVAAMPATLQSRSWRVYWEGYASGGLASGKTATSPLTYAAQIPSAREAAVALRDYIDRRSSGNAQITIIAHSLGCRVVLELLDSYANRPGVVQPEFPLVVLMAAAVPIYFFEDLSRLWRGALLPRHTLVFFSSRDIVLAWPFRIGQTAAGEGLLPKAVGATGRPLGGFWSRVVSAHNDHSGYFHDRNTAIEIARSLGLVVPRVLPRTCEQSAALQSACLSTVSLPSRKLRG